MPRGGKRIGAGRPTGTTKSEGMVSHVIRVPLDVSKDDATAIPALRAILDHWEAELILNPPDRAKNARYWYLKAMLEEIRALGY